MNTATAVLIIVVAAAGAIAVMLLIRRRAPDGGFFTDSDRAAGVFSVVGTGFAVLLAFVIFLAFESYDRARDKASVEAVAISQLYRTAKLFPAPARQDLHGELVCYARATIRDEWPTMRHERASPLVEHWLGRIERTIDSLELRTDKQRIAYQVWFDGSADRRDGRRGRMAEAAPLVPPLVWLALILGGIVIVGYMCLYADPREPRFVQATMMGAVTTMVVAGLLVVRFLDRPYEDVGGSIKPVAMQMSLADLEAQNSSAGEPRVTACDERGRPRPG